MLYVLSNKTITWDDLYFLMELEMLWANVLWNVVQSCATLMHEYLNDVGNVVAPYMNWIVCCLPMQSLRLIKLSAPSM